MSTAEVLSLHANVVSESVCMCVSIMTSLCMHAGLKRKQTGDRDLLESLAQVFERADDRAAEREERMRKLELEMEAKMREREERREERMFSMFTAVMQQMGNRPPQPPYSFPYPSYHQASQQPPYSSDPQSPMAPFTPAYPSQYPPPPDHPSNPSSNSP